MDEKEQDSKCNIFINTKTEDYSILDFKSPELKTTKTKLSEFVKPINTKQKRKATTKLKNIPKNQKDARPGKKSFQTSIESSYFKSKNNDDIQNSTTNLKVALVCPLCFKTFKDVDFQVAHMKICACKNNISTKTLLDAIELQKRQQGERKLLGLLAAPMVHKRKKSVVRKVNSHDSDFNLALALSKSLQEEDEFVNAKSAILVKNSKKTRNMVTVLEIRTQKERNCILTEKIAEILMDDEPFTQKPEKEIICNKKYTVKTDLKSHSLRDLFYESEKLWDKTELPRSDICFYVSNLSEYIFLPDKQVKEYEEDNRELSEDKTERSIAEKTFCKMSQNDLHLNNEKCENCNDKQYIDSLSNNWGNVLNDCSASDIIVFVDDNKYIWAHKLVFYVQCSNILLDVVPNNNLQFSTVKEKICWPDITCNVALAFLEFIYSGNIKKYFSICKDVKSFSALRHLARKYKVKELFVYLKRKEAETKQQIKIQMGKGDNLKKYSNISKRLLYKQEEVYKDEQSSEECLEGILNNSESRQIGRKSLALPATDTLSVKATNTRQTSPIRQSNDSPDMFDDLNDSIRSYKEKYVNHTIGTNKSQRCNNIDIDDSIDIDTDMVTIGRNIKENTNSLTSTPRSSRPMRASLNKLDIKRMKSNLSLFIEQFRTENAKSDFDTDSDVTTIATQVSSKLKRNPFNLNSDNSDQNFLYNGNTITKEKPGKKTADILNMFDHAVTSFPLRLHTTSEETDINMNLDFDLMENITELLENDEHAYTQKSTKSNSTNKSIIDMDGTIQNVINSPVTENLLESNASVHDLNGSIEICNESNSCVSSDSHSNDGELSVYTKYKKKHKNNSIVKYRNFPGKHTLNDSMKNGSEGDYCEAKNTTNMNIDIEVEIEPDITLISEKEKDKASDIEKSTLLFSQCTTNFNKTFDNEHEKTVNSSKLMYAKSECSIDTKRKKNNLSISSPEQKTNQSNLTESPVLILSSPEIDFVTSNINTCKKIWVNKVSNLNEFHNNTHIFEKDIYLANVCINDDDDDDDDRKIKKTSTIEACRKNGKSTTKDNDSMIQSIKPLATGESIQKFKRKSMLETNLKTNGKSKKNRKNNTLFPINTVDTVHWSPCNCGHKQVLRKVKSSIVTRDSCTPPPDYDGMKTPELHAELHKYGLKLQKRSRAVKLLTYIYNELHPTIPSTSKKAKLVVINSDDEEPSKRRCHSKNGNNFNNEYNYGLPPLQDSTEKSTMNMIDKTPQFPENETSTATASAPNIKDVFSELIKDQRELYNNILSYEPLCIDSVYSMLKGKGFKYKMSTLMDFLDEQCITFYFQDTKQSKKLEKVSGNAKQINKILHIG